MAYDDKLGKAFPTRSGAAIGPANEAEMLSAIDGVAGIRTQSRMTVGGVTPEGVVIETPGLITYCKTQNGAPSKFWNEPVEEEEEIVVTGVEMDSGAIDLIAVNPGNPDSALPGVLYYGTDQNQYVTLEQLLGKIYPPNIENLNPPLNGTTANSFSVVAVGDDVLGKKTCAAYCPASMFTGKARLYAQAQYGAPVKYWSWDVDPTAPVAPYLTYTGAGSILLTTSSGIYLDDEFNHWLLTFDIERVRITKLSRSSVVADLVPHLSDPAYSDAEKEKIEGYILSRSYPTSTMDFYIDIPGAPNPWMLGYGWKFNWSGTKADIIEHTYVPVSTYVGDTVSRHVRVTFYRDSTMYVSPGMDPVLGEKLRWKAELETVEGPVQWHNTKYVESISYPLWSLYVLEIFGPSTLGASYGDAPVYCFYKRDTLEVFRFYGSGAYSEVRYKRISEPASWIGAHDWSVENNSSYMSYGSTALNGAFGEVQHRVNAPKTAGFYWSEGSSVTTDTSYSLSRYILGTKTFNGTTKWFWGWVARHVYAQPTTASDSGPSQVATNSDGVAVYSSSSVVTAGPETYIGYGYPNSSYLVSLSYDRETLSGSHSEVTDHALIVPFQDAEAAYLWARSTTEEQVSGNGGAVTARETTAGAFYAEATCTKFVGESYEISDPWVRENGAGGNFLGAVPATTIPLTITTNYTDIIGKLVTSSGTVDFSPPTSMAPFFAGIPVVSEQYWTRSSLLGAIFGHGAEDRKGFKEFDSPPPFIGWA